MMKIERPQRQIVLIEVGGAYGELEVDVTFTCELAGCTQHEPDDASTREYHPIELDVLSIVTIKKLEELDENGSLVKVWPKGSDVRQLPGWSASD